MPDMTDPDQDATQDAQQQAPQPTSSKAAQPDAGYQGSDQGPFRCGSCGHFDGQSSCELVDGAIDPDGCCNLFSKGGNAQAGSQPDLGYMMGGDKGPDQRRKGMGLLIAIGRKK